MGSLYCRTRTLCLIHANLNFFTVHVHVNVLLLNNLHMVPILDLKPSDHRDTQTNRLEFVPWKSDCPAIPNHLQIIFASSSVTLKSAKNDMNKFLHHERGCISKTKHLVHSPWTDECWVKMSGIVSCHEHLID
jgi:hypothetical protein